MEFILLWLNSWEIPFNFRENMRSHDSVKKENLGKIIKNTTKSARFRVKREILEVKYRLQLTSLLSAAAFSFSSMFSEEIVLVGEELLVFGGGVLAGLSISSNLIPPFFSSTLTSTETKQNIEFELMRTQ